VKNSIGVVVVSRGDKVEWIFPMPLQMWMDLAFAYSLFFRMSRQHLLIYRGVWCPKDSLMFYTTFLHTGLGTSLLSSQLIANRHGRGEIPPHG